MALNQQETALDSDEKDPEEEDAKKKDPQAPAQANAENFAQTPQDNASADSGELIIAERYTVHIDKPLPELNSPHARAFSASDHKDLQNQFFALIADQHLLHRIDVLSAVRTLPAEYVLRPVNWGPIKWPGHGHLVFGAVFKCPKGRRVVNNLNAKLRPVREDELAQRYIKPIVVALRAFASRDVPYRSLRPDNLFFAEQEAQTIIVGENFMTPPGFDQPLMFETISNGMCRPYSRSRGSLDDDLYALGVTILFFYLGRRPGAGMSDEDLLAAKAEYGSYAALTGRQHVTREVKEIVQGLVVDDPLERWGIEDVSAWLDGRRGAPLRPAQILRSSRPIELNGKEYFSCPSLAGGISLNWESVAPLVENGDIQYWISSSFSGTPREATVDTVLTNEKLSANSANKDVLISNLCIALDPTGPLRFKEFAFMLDSLGSVLMAIHDDPQKIKLFRQLMISDVPLNWIAYNATSGVDLVDASKNMKQLQTYLAKETYGYGFLRCLYEFNDSLCCMSPLLKDYFVVQGEELLEALEEAAADFKSGILPIDKHIAAFIAARFFENFDSHFQQLSDSNDPGEITLAMMRIFGVLQWKVGPRRTPSLAQCLGELMPAVILRYHNCHTREELRKKLPKAIKSGSLVEILNLVDDPDKRQRDLSGYEAAMAEFSKMSDEIALLKESLLGENQNLAFIGHRSAAVFLTTLSIIAIGFGIYSF